MRLLFSFIILFFICCQAYGQKLQKPRSTHQVIQLIEQQLLAQLQKSLERKNYDLSQVNLKKIKNTLWKKYVQEQTQNPERKQEYIQHSLQFGDKTMHYAMTQKGKKPTNGYPLYIALHGGGGVPPEVNDSQWRTMQSYYLASIENGIYVAPRGITNTWNLHFVEESYPLYDRLIENLILFAGVDPNRVYLLGYSAGGDGVYQIISRMPDRWAAANMSAGHHNNVSPLNLQHVPFLLQVGELDKAYNRNKETVKFAQKLRKLQKKYPDDYQHKIFVHSDKHHSYVADHQGKEHSSTVIANPNEWLKNPEHKLQNTAVTDAITWISKHTRKALPLHLVWDINTRATSQNKNESQQGNLFYWLDAGKDWNKYVDIPFIEVKINRAKNMVEIKKWRDYLKIYFTSDMVDFNIPVQITYNNRTNKIQLIPNLRTMVHSLIQRGDPDFIFSAALVLQKEVKLSRE